MKRVRSDDDDILIASSSGGAVSVSRALAIEHSVTIANFLKDVPDATEFVIPDCEGMTLLWIEHAMEAYPATPMIQLTFSMPCALRITCTRKSCLVLQ